MTSFRGRPAAEFDPLPAANEFTLLLAAEIPLQTMRYRAGHQASTTAHICSNAIRAANEKAAEVLDNIVVQK